MSIQGMLQKGRSHASTLEKVADGVLAFPRAMWLNHKVSVITSGKKFEIKHSEHHKNFTRKMGDFFSHAGRAEYVGPFLWLIGAVAYLVPAILATPFLGAGLLLKKIALVKDKKGAAYHHMIEASTKEVVVIQNKKVLEEKIEKVRKQITALGVSKLPLEPPELKTDTEKAMHNLRVQTLKKFNSLDSENKKLEKSIQELNEKQQKQHKEVEKMFKQYKS